MKILSCLLVITFIVSCGKKDDETSQRLQWQQAEPDIGLYRVILKPINGEIALHKSFGTAIVNIKQELVEMKINMINAPSGKHYQAIHTFNSCPTAQHDLNADGFIDMHEGSKAFGKILIPLDGDLNSQLAGIDVFPVTGPADSFSYHKDISLRTMLADLTIKDEDTADEIVKLEAKEGLNLSRRTLVVFGLSPGVIVPDTIATFHDLPKEASIPIACGEIVRIHDEGN